MEVQVKDSIKDGKGLFALRDFKEGEKVYGYPEGRVVSGEELPNLSGEDRKFLDKIGENKFEIILPPARFVNHSCDPNIEEVNRVAYALRDIRAGEELTIDYDKVAFLDKPLICRCGSGNCRGNIQGIRWLWTTYLLVEYQHQGRVI